MKIIKNRDYNNVNGGWEHSGYGLFYLNEDEINALENRGYRVGWRLPGWEEYRNGGTCKHNLNGDCCYCVNDEFNNPVFEPEKIEQILGPTGSYDGDFSLNDSYDNPFVWNILNGK